MDGHSAEVGKIIGGRFETHQVERSSEHVGQPSPKQLIVRRAGKAGSYVRQSNAGGRNAHKDDENENLTKESAEVADTFQTYTRDGNVPQTEHHVLDIAA
jgi:hypothetical protein